MNIFDRLDQRTPKSRHVVFYIVLNLLGIVFVGKGVLLLSAAVSAGIGYLLLGCVMLICTPWIQHRISEADPDWEIPPVLMLAMYWYAVLEFIGMINPFI